MQINQKIWEWDAMNSVTESELSSSKHLCESVGEIILLTAAVDDQLNKIVILLLALKNSPMLEPLVATLDIARKIEILKIYGKRIEAQSWSKGFGGHADKIEKLNKIRNQAAHSTMIFIEGEAVLRQSAVAKMLKNMDLPNKKIKNITIKDLKAGIELGEATIESGRVLIVNLESLENQRRIRRKAH